MNGISRCVWTSMAPGSTYLPRAFTIRGVVPRSTPSAATLPPATSEIRPGHRLPEGSYHSVREREIDIEDYAADLRFDMKREEITGTATLTFTPLRSGLKEFSLDASDLEIQKVASGAGSASFSLRDRELHISLTQALNPGQPGSVSITYSCHPKTGMYFYPKSGTRAAQAWNYGEGGLHYGWL